MLWVFFVAHCDLWWLCLNHVHKIGQPSVPCCLDASTVRMRACIVIVVVGLISPKCLSKPV